jgi:aspartyl protease family protein
VIGWALRRAVLWCGVAFLCVGVVERGARLLPSQVAAPAGSEKANPSDEAAESALNTLVYPADARGHVVVDAAVNGAEMRLLIDTGASLVTLTPADALAAGIDPEGLAYTRRANTANGPVRMAPVILREIRIGQLSIAAVPAAVLENLNMSLLGQSFLNRLHSYEMHHGQLTITW